MSIRKSSISQVSDKEQEVQNAWMKDPKSERKDTHYLYGEIAKKAQRNVEILVLSILLSATGISLVSMLSVIEPASIDQKTIFGAFILLFLAGIIAQVTLQVTHYEDRWFQARAVAETSKSLEWQYEMGTGELEDSSGAESRLLDMLKKTRAEYSRSSHRKQMDAIGAVSEASEISEEMRRLRSLPWQEKRAEYLKHRIEDQSRWYHKKAKSNRRLSLVYTSAATAIEVGGIAVAAYGYFEGMITTEALLALIATLITSLVGWTQSRRYAELVEPYLYTGLILDELKKEVENVKSEQEFKDLIEETEHAISREHQMWQIRRGLSVRKVLDRNKRNEMAAGRA